MTTSGHRHVPISRVVIGEDEIEAVSDVLRSGNLREGTQCQAFEEEFARAVGARFALTANSGTAALQMAYQALLRPGDEVLVPSFTFFASASMVAAAGAVPVFCDIDPETLTIDIADAHRRITQRTRAIAPVHLFGNPVDVDAVRGLANAHNLAIIWDAAQAHGTLWDGRDVGALDDAVCYSFYPSKNMTTGEGGMVTTNREDLVETMKLLRSQGQTSRYLHTVIGYNFRMTDIQGAIGRGQLRHLKAWTERRRENAAYLRGRLAETPLLRVQREPPRGVHSYHQFTLLADQRVDRDKYVQSLQAAGIGSGVYYPIPQHQQPAFANISPTVSLPVTEEVSRRVLSVPVHPHLSEEDRAYVADEMLARLGSAAR